MRGRRAAQHLQTLRLTLRPPRPEDAAALAAAIGNYEVARWLGSIPFPYTEDDAHRFIAGAASKVGRVWMVFENGTLVGGAGLDGELGYWLARPVWGRGLATELGETLVDVHFADRRAGPLASGHYLDNERSARVLEKLGFRPDRVVQREARVLAQTVESRRMVMDRTDWSRLRRYRLSTPRLTLRGLRPEDARAVMRLVADDSVAARLSHLPAPQSRPEAVRWIHAVRYCGRPAFVTAVLGRLDRVIGLVGLRRPDTGGPLELGLVLAPDQRGKGCAFEAAEAFVADMRRRHGLTHLSAKSVATQPASAAVLRKLGFVPAGAASAPSSLEAAPAMDYRLTMDG